MSLEVLSRRRPPETNSAVKIVQPFPTIECDEGELVRPPREFGTLVEHLEPVRLAA